MADAYEFADVEAEDLGRVVSKLRGNIKNRDVVLKHLKLAAGVLERLPQDVTSLGATKEGLGDLLIEKSILGSKHKDVKMYAAGCLVHLLRIYAPDTPYEDDKDMEAVFDLLLWSVQQVQEYQSPMFELAVSVLQTISQTKSYYLLLDMGKDDVIVEWVRSLLQCINSGSQTHAGPHALEVLNGLVGDEGATDAMLEVLLSQLVPPRSQESPAACQMAQSVLRACESVVKPQLQKFVTTLILSPISSNSDLHQHCYALIYQLYQCVPQVLLPVIPHITSELQAEDPAKRLEAVQLVCQLFAVPGNKLVCEYDDVLDALLGRYRDTQVDVRSYMVDFTPTLVAGVGSEDRQQKVLKEAAVRLQDYEEKIRLAAVKAVCQVVRQLVAGPAGAAKGGTAGAACKQSTLALAPPPVADMLTSQEDDEIAAADLGVAYTPPEQEVAAGAGVADAVKELPYLQDVLKMVCMRLRDTKPTVRKQTASNLMALFRAVAAAGAGEQLSRYCELPARVLLCCKTDVELRSHVVESSMKDGLLGAQVAASQAAAVWARLWLNCTQVERDVLMLMLAMRARLQADALTFLVLRRKLSGKDKDPDAAETLKHGLDKAARLVSGGMPHTSKAMEGLATLQAVRDNHVFAALQQALAPGATAQVYAKARADALSRVGSRGACADFISQLLLWARPAAWLPQPLLAAMLELAADDPDGDQGDLVRSAFQLLRGVSKVAPMVFAGLLPQLYSLLQSSDADLQQLAVQLIVQCARDQRKRGIVLATSADAATATLVKKQLLPRLRQLARGSSTAAPGAPVGSSKGASKHKQQRARQTRAQNDAENEQSDGNGDVFYDAMEDGSQGAAGAAAAAAPRAAKWAVYGLAACQDSSSSRSELAALADELVQGLDSAAPETAAKLQALAAIGRVLPDAFSRHAEQLLSFVLDDYLLTYLDAAATAPAGAAGGQSSRSPGFLSPGASLRSPCAGRDNGAPLTSSSQAEAAAVWLKALALKALAAGCVPDSDSTEVPVETQQVASRLAQDLEGLLDPMDEGCPEFLADASPEAAGQLRLAAAAALLRLARRHDSRLGCSCYCMLGLVMQDPLEGVRAAFANKVFKLVKYFNMRPSTHQLAAKYAAMLPLASADPVFANKEAAARQYKEWVHQRRATVQQNIMLAAAAANGTAVHGGGSTLQDLPEMVVPYGLYILAHHPDFPMDEDADDVAAYEPFQFMLQFMLQPLLVASAGTPAGGTAPALVKMCTTLKLTADKADEPATNQLYVLCDMAVATVQALAEHMGVDNATVTAKYPGSITLPKNLYTPLDKEHRVAAKVSYLPPGFEAHLDPEPVAALAHGPGMLAAAATAAADSKRPGRGSKPKAAAAAPPQTGAAAAAGRRSKRKAGQGVNGSDMGSQDGDGNGRPAKRSKGRNAAAGVQRGSRARRAADSSDDEWNSDDDAPPSAVKSDQQLTKRQQKLQQHKLQPQPSAAGDSRDMSGDEAHSPPLEQQKNTQRQQQQQQQQRQSTGRQQSAGQMQQQQGRASIPDSRHATAAEDAGDRQPAPQQPTGRNQPRQQRQQQKLQDLKQQQLTFQAPAADASSPAPIRRRTRADADAAAAADAVDDSARGLPAAADAAASPSASPPAAVRRGAQRSAGLSITAANGHAAAAAVNGVANGVLHGVMMQKGQRHAAGRGRPKGASKAAADVEDASQDDDVDDDAAAETVNDNAAASLQDRTPQKDATKKGTKTAAAAAGRGKAAASKSAAGKGGHTTASGMKRRDAAAAGHAAAGGSGRVTRRRAG